MHSKSLSSLLAVRRTAMGSRTLKIRWTMVIAVVATCFVSCAWKNSESGIPSVCSSEICAYLQDSGEELNLGVINRSTKDVLVPWLSAVNGPISGFHVENLDSSTDDFRTSPFEISEFGNSRLPPGGFYGISLNRKRFRDTFHLPEGCSNIVLRFHALRQDAELDDVILRAEAPAQRICL